MTTAQELNLDFTDLYGDALISVIKLNEVPTFETIKAFFSDMETMEKEFDYKGRTVIAKRKFTYKGGKGKMFQVKTNFLHIWIQTGKSKNTLTHYREDKNGNFKTI